MRTKVRDLPPKERYDRYVRRSLVGGFLALAGLCITTEAASNKFTNQDVAEDTRIPALVRDEYQEKADANDPTFWAGYAEVVLSATYMFISANKAITCRQPERTEDSSNTQTAEDDI